VNRGSSVRVRTVLGIAASTIALVAAGCSSSSHNAAPPPAGATSTSAALSGSPVNIGFIDIEGSLGIGNFKPQRVVAQQYVSYLNSTGGLSGHPIHLITCVTQEASGGANCANEFVQQHAVLALDFSAIDTASVYPILKAAGIPVFGGGNSPLNAADLTPDGNHWFVDGGALVGFSVENAVIADTFHAKTVGLLVGSASVAQQAAQLFIEKPLNALGITTKAVTIQETNPDYTSALDTVSSTDVLEVLAGAGAVDTANKQAKSLGYAGKRFAALSPADITAMGSAAAGVYGALTGTVPDASNASQPDVAQYASFEHRYGWDLGDIGVYQLVATAINVIKAAGGATATGLQVRNTFASATNIPIPLGSPAGLNCSTPPSKLAPTACNVQLMFYQVQSDGSVQPVTGQWVSPAA
jgi:hypothetical protein